MIALQIILWFFVGSLYASVMEWLVHKYVLHKPLKVLWFKITHPYESHHKVHHVIFGADASYRLETHPHEKQNQHAKTIPMAWYGGLVLISLTSLPFNLWSCFVPGWWLETLTIVGAITFDYVVYEYTHYCMHKDSKGRWFKSTAWYKFMSNHHILHHKYFGYNLNVVWPFADWIFGTLVRTSAEHEEKKRIRKKRVFHSLG